MTDLGKAKGKDNGQDHGGKPRWQRLVNLPDNVELRDMATGNVHLRGRLRPVYLDKSNIVNEFEVLAHDKQPTGERVYASFLRLKDDGIKCSIGGK